MTAVTSAPRYGSASLAELLPDAVAALLGEPTVAVPLPAGLDAVLVLVVDGLGRRNLDAHRDVAPFLAGLDGVTLDAPFPTTTATSLVTIGTGLPPGEHAVTGYSLAVPGDDRPLIALTWSWERQDLGIDARGDVVPDVYQPAATVFERARARGVHPVTVLRPEFERSGLTRAGLRGGEVVAAAGLEATLAAAVDAASAPGPRVVYAHHGDLDAWGHVAGPSSDPWCEQLQLVDGALARLAEDLPSRVAVVVTADHGMVGVPPDGFVELADHPDLLTGVRVLTGDARARQLHARPGAATDVLTAWQEHARDRAAVASRDDAIAAGWFGPTITDRARTAIGDVVVAARATDVAWVHRDADPFGGRLTGLHGGLAPIEVEVPALVLST